MDDAGKPLLALWQFSGKSDGMMAGMALSPFVFDVTRENFAQLVLGNSERGLVLVHFWSPKAGPCLVLMPRLVRLASEYGGKFLMVMANTDELGRLAREWNVTSVPTVKFFRGGKVVHTVHGAESDAAFRAAIAPYLARESDRAHADSVQLFRQGQAEEAYALLARAALEDPDNARLPVELAKLMMLNGEHQRAHDFLRTLPASSRNHLETEHLLVHLTLMLAAHDAPDEAALRDCIRERPDDLDARLKLAAQRLIDDDYGPALDELIEIARRDRRFCDDIGRRAAVTVLAMPGISPELASGYRSLLADALRQAG